MRINLLIVFSFLAFFGFATTIYAQNNSVSSVEISGNTSVRESIFPITGQSDLEICGLEEGQTYNVFVSSLDYGSTLSLGDNQFQYRVEFVADAACRSLLLVTDYVSGNEAPIVSVVCQDCGIEEKEEVEKSILTVNGAPNLNADFLVRDVFIGGDCFETSAASAQGSPLSVGTFSGGSLAFGFGFDEGIVLSTGYVSNLSGPSSNFSSNGTGGISGDEDLEAISTVSINDVSILEFDFVPTVDQVSFEYIFASEEYCQYSNNPMFNDVFGFFLSGPGISGPYSNGSINIATVPGTTDNVSIANVSNLNNQVYFSSNGETCPGGGIGMTQLAFNGNTTAFTSVANVIPCETYHIKLAIGDGTDTAWDSAVFLKANSFDAGGAALGEATVPLTGSNDSYESAECGTAFFTFTREGGDLTQPVYVEYELEGTATEGIDFTGLPPSPIVIPPFTPSWQVPITILEDDIAEGLETVTLFLFGACTCEAAEVTLNIYDLEELNVNVPDIDVCDGFPAILQASVDNGVPPIYFYDWGSGPAAVPILTTTPTETTSYSVTVTDICGSSGIGVGTANVVTPAGVLDGSASLCGDGGGAASLNINFSGSEGPFEIVYSLDGELQAPITDITDNPYELPITETGTYALEIVTIPGCLGEASGIIDVAGSSTQVATAFTNADCPGSSSGSIDLMVTDADGAVTYAWSNGSTLEDQASLAAGDYMVTINAAGCEIIESFTLTENPEITATLDNSQGVDCSNPNIGELDITAGGGSGTLSYLWNNGATTEDLTGIAAGTYSVTVSDTDGCEFILEDLMVTGSTDAPMAASVQSGNIDCDNTSVTLSATGSTTGTNISYEWTDEDDVVIASGPDEDEISVDEEGVYTLTVINTDGGCSAEAPLTVTIDNQGPTANAGAVQNLTCNEETVQLNGTASANGDNITYQWSGPSGATITDGTTNAPTVDAIGTYTITVTDTDNGCSTTSEVTVGEETTEPTIVITMPASFDCSTEDIDLDASGSSTGAFSYQWSTTGDGTILGATTLTPNIDMPGDYQLVITDNNTGCDATETITIADDSAFPTIVVATPEVVTCEDEIIMIDASASDTGFDVSWIVTGGSGTLTDANTLTPTVDGGGTFLLTISDPATGCESQELVMVTENTTPPVAAADMPSQLDCNDPTVTITTSGSSSGPGITYSWSVLSGSGTITNPTSASPTVDAPGTYELLVTNEFGCIAATNVTITGNPETPIAEIAIDDNITCAHPSSNITGAGSSVGDNFTYTWDLDGEVLVDENSFSLNNLSAAGTYTLTVSNSGNGCEESAFVTITADTLAPSAIAASMSDLDCLNETISLDGSGSDQGSDISYTWTTGNNTAFETTADTISPVINAVGIYYLTVTNDASGCTAVDSVEVASNEILPIIDIEDPAAIDCNNETPSISAAVSATGTNITYEWTGTGVESGADTNMPTVNASGTYTLTATDNDNGCVQTETVIVDDIRALPTANAGQTAEVNCNNTTLELNAGSSSGTGALSYAWTATNGGVIDANEDMVNPTISAAGTYIVTVLDASNGCENTSEVIITDDFAEPTAIAGDDDQLNCGDESLSLSGTGSTTTDVTYLWTATNGGEVPAGQEVLLNPEIMLAGTYNLLVTGVNGCTATDEVTIATDDNAPVVSVVSEGDITCLEEVIGLTATISNAGDNFDYAWATSGSGNFESGETSLTPNVDAPGTYQLTVINNDNNCDATFSMVVNENTTEPALSLSVSNVIDCNNEVATLMTDGSDAGGDFSLIWTTDGVEAIPTDTENPLVTLEGSYTLTIVNSINGCESEQTVPVIEDTVIPTVVASSDLDITCEQGAVPLSGMGSSEGNEFSYVWTNLTTGEVVGTELNMTIEDAGEYELEIMNTLNGCTDSETTIVMQDADFPEVQIATADVLNCITQATELDATGTDVGGTITYQWQVVGSGGEITAGSTTLMPSITGAGIYELTVTNSANDCVETEQITVTEDTTEPTITINEADAITCTETDVTLTAVTANGENFVWTGAGTIDNNETATPTVFAAGTYTVTATHTETGCEGTSSIVVTDDLDLPSVDAGTNYLINCETNSVTLTGTSDASNATYTWTHATNGEEFIGQSVTVETGGIYTLTVTNLENECSDSAETQVNSDQPTALAIAETAADCISGFGNAVFSDVIGGTPGYIYSIDGGETFTQNTAFTQLEAGAYEVIVQDLNGCEFSDEFTIDAPEELTVDFGEEEDMIELKLGETYQFNADINKDEDILVSIIWTPEDSLSCLGCLNPLATPTESARYSLVVKDSLGCTAEASLLLIVDRRPSVYIPTAFSPNNDDSNEVFYVFADEGSVERIVSFEIYSRWGEPVHKFYDFEANNPNFGWDGSFRGQKMNSGVFAYSVVVEMADGRTETFTGNVTLIR